MIVTVKSDDGVAVDLKIKVLPGAGFRVSLGSKQDDGCFKISGLPTRDQRCWISKPDGTFEPWQEDEDAS